MACRNCFATNFLLWNIFKPCGIPCLQIKLSLYLLRASTYSLSVSHSLCSFWFLFFFFNVLTILALCQLWQKCQTRLSTSFINIKTKLAKFHLHSLTYIFLPDFVSLNRSLAVLKRNYAFFFAFNASVCSCVCVSALLVHFFYLICANWCFRLKWSISVATMISLWHLCWFMTGGNDRRYWASV